MKKVVILATTPPYGSVINAEAFRVGLGLAFSEISVDLVLAGDGVYAAVKGQQPAALQMKSMAEAYENVGQFKINLFVESAALPARKLAPADMVPVAGLDDAALHEKISMADAVITF
jgi:sulfur relay protein TusC/DsrF